MAKCQCHQFSGSLPAIPTSDSGESIGAQRGCGDRSADARWTARQVHICRATKSRCKRRAGVALPRGGAKIGAFFLSRFVAQTRKDAVPKGRVDPNIQKEILTTEIADGTDIKTVRHWLNQKFLSMLSVLSAVHRILTGDRVQRRGVYACIGWPLVPGFRITLMQPSTRLEKVSYICGASSRAARWVMTKLGSISPFCTRSSRG